MLIALPADRSQATIGVISLSMSSIFCLSLNDMGEKCDGLHNGYWCMLVMTFPSLADTRDWAEYSKELKTTRFAIVTFGGSDYSAQSEPTRQDA